MKLSSISTCSYFSKQVFNALCLFFYCFFQFFLYSREELLHLSWLQQLKNLLMLEVFKRCVLKHWFYTVLLEWFLCSWAVVKNVAWLLPKGLLGSKSKTESWTDPTGETIWVGWYFVFSLISVLLELFKYPACCFSPLSWWVFTIELVFRLIESEVFPILEARTVKRSKRAIVSLALQGYLPSCDFLLLNTLLFEEHEAFFLFAFHKEKRQFTEALVPLEASSTVNVFPGPLRLHSAFLFFYLLRKQLRIQLQTLKGSRLQVCYWSCPFYPNQRVTERRRSHVWEGRTRRISSASVNRSDRVLVDKINNGRNCDWKRGRPMKFSLLTVLFLRCFHWLR